MGGVDEKLEERLLSPIFTIKIHIRFVFQAFHDSY